MKVVFVFEPVDVHFELLEIFANVALEQLNKVGILLLASDQLLQPRTKHFITSFELVKVRTVLDNDHLLLFEQVQELIVYLIEVRLKLLQSSQFVFVHRVLVLLQCNRAKLIFGQLDNTWHTQLLLLT